MSRAKLVSRRYLDPRPAAEATVRPIVEAVNVPLAELPQRTHELPPREQTVEVVGPPVMSRAAADWLTSHGRCATCVTEFAYDKDRSSRETGRLWQPTAWLAEVLPKLRPGRALELACGSGRDAVFMASEGWRVTAVDVLPDALARARALERRCAAAVTPVRWVERDLEESPLECEAAFDLIVGFRYLHRPLFRHMARWVAPGGSVVWETFTTAHRERHGKPAADADVMSTGELPTLLAGLEVRAHVEGWHGDRHTARIWAVRAG